jgi:DNA-binding MarR family transcriptional regulator
MKIEEEIHSRFRNDRHKAGVNLIYTSNWFSDQISGLLKRYELTMQQYNVLRILRGIAPQPVSVKYIRERMLDKMPDVSRMVEKLRERGLVDRHECPEDRRNVNITITQAGLDLLGSVDPDLEIGEEIFQLLSDQEVVLFNLLLDKLRDEKKSQ